MIVCLGDNLKAIASMTVAKYIENKQNLKKLALSVLSITKERHFHRIDTFLYSDKENNPEPEGYKVLEDYNAPFDVWFVTETDGTKVLFFIHHQDNISDTRYNPWLN